MILADLEPDAEGFFRGELVGETGHYLNRLGERSSGVLELMRACNYLSCPVPDRANRNRGSKSPESAARSAAK